MIRYVVALALVLLAACGAERGSVPLGPMVIGDRKPVDFDGRQPTSYPVRGIDVARFQTSVDWDSARAAGVAFAFIKSTEGGDLKDRMFEDHWRGAARAGIARGAYHFYYFCTPPEVQARFFIQNVPRSRGSLPPVLDMEWNPFSPTCRYRPPAAEVRAQMRVWLDMVERHYGRRPIIYTTPEFYIDAGLEAMRREEFWLRATARHPREVYPGQPWRFWQYTATGILPGTPGDVDINVFNGSAAAWRSWLASRAQ